MKYFIPTLSNYQTQLGRAFRVTLSHSTHDFSSDLFFTIYRYMSRAYTNYEQFMAHAAPLIPRAHVTMNCLANMIWMIYLIN